MTLKIACDVGVAKQTAQFLRDHGFSIVCRAEHGESDQSWFDRALKNNANVFLSGDFDIALMIDKEYDLELYWINTLNKPCPQANIYLLRRLVVLEERLNRNENVRIST